MKNWSFKIDNDKSINLVLNGKKNAYSLNYNEKEIPQINEESIIHFDNEKDACKIKIIDYKILKFKDVTLDEALLEGYSSLDIWKKKYLDLFKKTNSSFNEENIIIFVIFKVTNNFVKERLELGKKIANLNLDLFNKIESLYEINAGFNNTLFSVNNKYIIKVCTNTELEISFEKEYNFYKSNSSNKSIPKLYKYDNTKKEVNYLYEIIEKLNGNTLYYYWYKMNEIEREETIKKLISIIKSFHNIKANEYDWAKVIKEEIQKRIKDNKDLFSDEDYDIIIKSLNKYDEILKDNYFALIHNDLHFDNIIYDNGNIKIIDFNDCLSAPIDFEFRQLYICQYKPWKWANIEMDPYQKEKDYKNIWNYIKKYYDKLNDINYLEERMIIYRIWNDSEHLKKYHSKELIDSVVENSKKILELK